MNTNNQINGLLTQKPDSPVPQVGAKRRFSVIEMKSARTGKPYTKIKSEGEGYGQLYEIVSVQKTEHVDQYGNVSFNVSLSPAANGSGNGDEPNRRSPNPIASAPGRGIQKHSALTKDEYWSRKEERDIEGSRRMGRAHAQDMAIAYAKLTGLTDIKPDDMRALIGWFEQDVDRGPTVVNVSLSPGPKTTSVQGNPDETGEDNGFDL